MRRVKFEYKRIAFYIRNINWEQIDLRNIDWRKANKRDMEIGFRKMLKSPYLYISLGVIVGVLFTIQFKTESVRSLNPVLFYNELVDIKDSYSGKQNDLKIEIKALQDEIRDKENILRNKNFISSSLLNDLNNQEFMFGSTDIEGDGIKIVLSDGINQTKDDFSKSLAHAADLRDIINLLWYAGAEAISINGERIIYNTSIDCIVSTIMINSNNYVPPYEIKAVGNKHDLYNVINNSRKLVDIKKRASKKQINFEMTKLDKISIQGYSGVYFNL